MFLYLFRYQQFYKLTALEITRVLVGLGHSMIFKNVGRHSAWSFYLADIHILLYVYVGLG